MNTDQFVPVIPDIKDHSMAPPVAPEPVSSAPAPAPTATTSWWDWDTWPLPMKLAMGALLVSLICLVIYAAYVWFTKKQKESSEAAKKKESGDSGGGDGKQDMAAIMQTQAMLKKRREEELRRAHAKQAQPVVILTTEMELEDDSPEEPPRVEILDDSDGDAPPKKRLVPSPTAPTFVTLPVRLKIRLAQPHDDELNPRDRRLLPASLLGDQHGDLFIRQKALALDRLPGVKPDAGQIRRRAARRIRERHCA
jgi:hypothetical protein